MSDTLEASIRSAGLRVTRQRVAVLDLLQDRSDALSAQEVYLSFRQDGDSIGLSTVYRTLTSLAEAGLLDALPREGEQTFRLCSPKHHHHLICTECNAVTELGGELVEEWVSTVASTYRFQVTGHRADIYGRCEDCTG